MWLALFSRSSHVAFTGNSVRDIFIDHGVDNDPLSARFRLFARSARRIRGQRENVRGPRKRSRPRPNRTRYVRLHSGSGTNRHFTSPAPGQPHRMPPIRSCFVCGPRPSRRRRPAAQRCSSTSRDNKACNCQVYDLLSQAVAGTKTGVETPLWRRRRNFTHSSDQRLRVASRAEYARQCDMAGHPRATPKATPDVRVRLFNSEQTKRLEEEDEQWPTGSHDRGRW